MKKTGICDSQRNRNNTSKYSLKRKNNVEAKEEERANIWAKGDRRVQSCSLKRKNSSCIAKYRGKHFEILATKSVIYRFAAS